MACTWRQLAQAAHGFALYPFVLARDLRVPFFYERRHWALENRILGWSLLFRRLSELPDRQVTTIRDREA